MNRTERLWVYALVAAMVVVVVTIYMLSDPPAVLIIPGK